MRPFIRTAGLDRQNQVFENSVNDVFQSIYKNPLLNDARISTGIVLGTSDTYVSHGLNRNPTGYIICGSNANAVVYTSSTTNLQPTASIILKASAAVTVNILFF